MSCHCNNTFYVSAETVKDIKVYYCNRIVFQGAQGELTANTNTETNDMYPLKLSIKDISKENAEFFSGHMAFQYNYNINFTLNDVNYFKSARLFTTSYSALNQKYTMTFVVQG